MLQTLDLKIKKEGGQPRAEELKNRIAYLGMGAHLSTMDHFITDREVAYYENYAKNGVAWMCTGTCATCPDYPSGGPFTPGLYDDMFIPGMKKLTDAVHKHGAKIVVQPWRPGQLPYGCSLDDVKTCADFTVEELHHVQQPFVEAAVRAQKGGFDGMEYHIAHNYLPEQMSVPLFNMRTDEYGADTVENAARFNAEAIKMIREACGEDFMLGIKINAWDMGFEGGMTPEWCVALCKEFEKVGIDWISVSAGGSATDSLGMSADGSREEGWKLGWARMVKEAVNVPVMATGSIRHLDVMEKALEDGTCDIIGMARGLLAEPEFVKKVEEGREKELRHCLSCLSCMAFPNPVPNTKVCSLNPIAKWELFNQEPLKVDGEGRKVMIVGAGPAGANAAFVKKTVEKFGKMDVFFANAGVLPAGEFARYEACLDAWTSAIDINIKGNLYGICASYDQFKEQGYGHFLTTSSTLGDYPAMGQAIYCATKIAVRYLAHALRVESPALIKTTIINPSSVPSTDLSATGKALTNYASVRGGMFSDFNAVIQNQKKLMSGEHPETAVHFSP